MKSVASKTLNHEHNTLACPPSSYFLGQLIETSMHIFCVFVEKVTCVSHSNMPGLSHARNIVLDILILILKNGKWDLSVHRQRCTEIDSQMAACLPRAGSCRRSPSQSRLHCKMHKHDQHANISIRRVYTHLRHTSRSPVVFTRSICLCVREQVFTKRFLDFK